MAEMGPYRHNLKPTHNCVISFAAWLHDNTSYNSIFSASRGQTSQNWGHEQLRWKKAVSNSMQASQPVGLVGW